MLQMKDIRLRDEDNIPESDIPMQVKGSHLTEEHEKTVLNGALFIAMPSRGMVHLDLLTSYMGLIKPRHYFLSTNQIPIDSARNQLVSNFLVKSPDATHLLFWDDDIIPRPDALMKLWSHNKPIVSGLYFRKGPPHEPVMGIKLTSPQGQEGFSPFVNWEDGKTYSVDGVGMGFCLIRKDVFQAMEYPWFHFGQYSEDYTFCEKAKELGFKVLIDTSVILNHLIDKQPINVEDFNKYRQDLVDGQMFFR